jgi:AMP nucleosidase
MKTKEDIIKNWLPRYTGTQLEEFGKYIILINFSQYLELFAEWYLETATIFIVGFANEIPTGALLLVSDQPMISSGIKTEKSDMHVSENFVELHLKIGVDSLKQLINNGMTVKHLKF